MIFVIVMDIEDAFKLEVIKQNQIEPLYELFFKEMNMDSTNFNKLSSNEKVKYWRFVKHSSSMIQKRSDQLWD
jgi:hypothetical protein